MFIIFLFSIGLIFECYNTITCNGKSKRCVKFLSKTCIGNLSNEFNEEIDERDKLKIIVIIGIPMIMA